MNILQDYTKSVIFLKRFLQEIFFVTKSFYKNILNVYHYAMHIYWSTTKILWNCFSGKMISSIWLKVYTQYPMKWNFHMRLDQNIWHGKKVCFACSIIIEQFTNKIRKNFERYSKLLFRINFGPSQLMSLQPKMKEELWSCAISFQEIW